MRLDNTTSAQDAILSTCEDFGGAAAQCAQIAAELDNKIQERDNQIRELEAEVRNLADQS